MQHTTHRKQHTTRPNNTIRYPPPSMYLQHSNNMEASPLTNNQHTRPTNVKRGEAVEEGVDRIKCNLDKAQMYIVPRHSNSPNTKDEADNIPKEGVEEAEAVVAVDVEETTRTPT